MTGNARMRIREICVICGPTSVCPRGLAVRLLKVFLPTLLAALASSVLLMAQEEGEEEPYLPGLNASYSDSAGHSFRRLDEAIAFDWGGNSPDGRIAADGFKVQWRGKLF